MSVRSKIHDAMSRSTGDTSTEAAAAAAAAASPTSILDTKPFSAFRNPFCSWRKGEPMRTGLGLLDALTIDEVLPGKNSCVKDHRKVVFGSQLKVQIPPPVEFDISSRNCQMPPDLSSESLFVGSEIELSEEYTCGFLSFCYGCKEKLGPGMDVYIYRDKSFCSNECRCQAMLSDDEEE